MRYWLHRNSYPQSKSLRNKNLEGNVCVYGRVEYRVVIASTKWRNHYEY